MASEERVFSLWRGFCSRCTFEHNSWGRCVLQLSADLLGFVHERRNTLSDTKKTVESMDHFLKRLYCSSCSLAATHTADQIHSLFAFENRFWCWFNSNNKAEMKLLKCHQKKYYLTPTSWNMRGCVLVVIKESLLKLCEVFLWAYFYTVKRKVKRKCKTKEDKNRTCFSWLEVVSLCCPPPHFPSNMDFYRFLVSFTSKMTLKVYPSVSEIESKI